MKFKYVRKETTRHGKTVYYLRRENDGERIRIQGDYGSPAFIKAYGLALAGIPTSKYRKFATPRREAAIRAAMSRAVDRAKDRAKKRQFGFDITHDWIMAEVLSQDMKCALTRIPFYFGDDIETRRNPYAPSIDRVDCKRGYTRDNVRIVIFAVNIMLSDWGEDVLAHVVQSYRENKRTPKKSQRCGKVSCRTRQRLYKSITCRGHGSLGRGAIMARNPNEINEGAAKLLP